MAVADLVLVNGPVLTVDARFSTARAVAVKDGHIMATGTTEAIRELTGRRTEVVDVAGRTVLPGINDSHLHACAYGLNRPPFVLDVSYPAARSIAEVAGAVAAAAGETPAGHWIRGKGWDTGYLAECTGVAARQPRRADLDRVAPHHPVCLQDFSGHQSWVNSRALEAAGIHRGTADPPGGTITLDGDGEPDGLLRESAQALVQRAIPPVERAQRAGAVRAALGDLCGEGITSFTEPGLGPGGEALFFGALGGETIQVYADLARGGELDARVSALLLPASIDGSTEDLVAGLEGSHPPADVDERLFRVLGVKIFADGIPPNRTAWLYDSYTGGGCGSLCVAGETDEQRAAEVTGMVRAAHDAGHQVGVHVTGDRAIDTVVRAFAEAAHARPRPDPRHYVIHGDLISRDTLDLCAHYGFGVNMNPGVKWTTADLMDEMLGADRSRYQWPVRTAMDAGVSVCASSDAPVVEPNWRQGIAGMLRRESRASGRPSGPEQCVGLERAVRAYTINAARQDFAETWKGSLEPGKVADLCVLDGDLAATDPADLPGTGVTMTVFGGRVVHSTL